MRGDSIRLQIPLINLVSSTRLVHANELSKCIAVHVSVEKENKVCIKGNEAWVVKKEL